MSPENGTLERSLLRIFRLSIALALLLQAAQIVVYPALVTASVPRISEATVVAEAICVVEVLLLVYLYLPAGTRRWLGRAYLPLGLAVGTLLPILQQKLLLWSALVSRGSGAGVPVALQTLTAAGNWLPLLFVPLVIVAWR